MREYAPDSAGYGENVARTIRIIAKIMQDWATKHPKRGETYLKAIYFDKLAEFVCRIWDELHENDKVRHKSAFQKRRGIHGPGRATRIIRKRELGVRVYSDFREEGQAYITEIVDVLKPSFDNARIPFSIIPNSSDPECRIYPQLVDSQWDAWLKVDNDFSGRFLDPDEVQYLIHLSEFFCKLNENEIRAIGTHYSCAETVEDIKFNIRIWGSYFSKVISINPDDDTNEKTKSVNKLVFLSIEVLRKCRQNSKDYKKAFNKLNNFMPDGVAKSIVLGKQDSPKDIWNYSNDDLAKFDKYAKNLYNFSLYIVESFIQKSIIQNHKIKGSHPFTEADRNLMFPGSFSDSTPSLPYYNKLNITDTDSLINQLVLYKKMLFDLLPPLQSYSKDDGGIF